MLLDLLGYAGNALDLPGSSVRDLLTGNNPFDQWATPFSDKNRASGRDVLAPLLGANEATGIGGWFDNPMEGLKDIAGFGAEMFLDPTNLVGSGVVRGLAKSRKAIEAAERTAKLREAGKYGYVNARVLADQMLNPMTEYAPAQKLLGYTPERPRGFHGGHPWDKSATPEHPYGMFDMSRIGTGEGNAAFTQGFYNADRMDVGQGYQDLVQRELNAQFVQDPEVLKEYFKPGRVLPSESTDGTDETLIEAFEFMDDINGNYRPLVTVRNRFSPDKPWGPAIQHSTLPTLEDLERTLGPQRVPKARLYELDRPHSFDQNAILLDQPFTAQPGTAGQFFQEMLNPLDTTELNRQIEVAQEAVRQAHDPWKDAYYKGLESEDELYGRYIEAKEILDGLERQWDELNADFRPTTESSGADLLEEITTKIPARTRLQDVQPLIEAGIPGVSFFDRGSRAAGQGTKNHVIWDQNIINQMRVRGIDGERVPINPTTTVVQQPVQRPQAPATREDMIQTIVNPMAGPSSANPELAAGLLYNMLARQSAFGGLQ